MAGAVAAEQRVATLFDRDRLAVVEAYEEAAVAAVAEDLLDEETLAVLTMTADRLTGLSGLPIAGSLAEFSPTSAFRSGPVRALLGSCSSSWWLGACSSGPAASGSWSSAPSS